MAKRIAYVLVATLMLLASSPFLGFGRAGAAQFSNRSITLSDSSPSGTSITPGVVGSGTNVTYKVQFTPTNNAASLVIDFCSNDPIVNDTCTRPTGMTAATGVASGTSGTVGNSGWTLTAAAGQAKLARTAGSSSDDIQAGTTQTFTLTGITNPSTTGSFYARMYSYTNATFGTYDGPEQSTGPPATVGAGNFVDYGGVALSTATPITITARVQEQLTFCVTSADPGISGANWNDCSDTPVGSNPPALILGHGTPTAVLDNTHVDTGSVWSGLSTNATTGAVIRMRNSNLTCGGLSADTGTTCAIPAVGSGSATPSAILTTDTNAAFGMFADDSTLGADGVGSVAADATFHGAPSHNDPTTPATLYYDMSTDVANSVTSTYGASVAASTSPTYRTHNQYVFAAKSALTTPAGIYTANLSMIATGTF